MSTTNYQMKWNKLIINDWRIEEASHSILLLPTDDTTSERLHKPIIHMKSGMTKNEISLPTKNKLGTFSGVFVPTGKTLKNTYKNKWLLIINSDRHSWRGRTSEIKLDRGSSRLIEYHLLFIYSDCNPLLGLSHTLAMYGIIMLLSWITGIELYSLIWLILTITTIRFINECHCFKRRNQTWRDLLYHHLYFRLIYIKSDYLFLLQLQ